MPAISLKIFVSSPGDVADERFLCEKVIRRLQAAYQRVCRIEPIFWEHEPLVATETFQTQLPPPDESDIVVCILWSRLGTRLPKAVTGGVYQTGTEYEFTKAAEGKRLRGRPDLLVYRKEADPLVSLRDPDRADEAIKQKRALDAFVEHWFHGEEGTLIAAIHPFADAATFEEHLEHHLRKLIEPRLPRDDGSEAEGPFPAPTWTAGSPFRGLNAFDYEHESIFFGRTRAVSGVVEQLKRQAERGRAFVLILGTSGCGKSSLVRAGVVPWLSRPGVIEGVGLCRRAVFRPSDKSGDIFDGLAAALLRPDALPELAADGTTPAELATMLREQPDAVPLLIKGALSQSAALLKAAEEATRQPEARLLFVVDQLEELFTLDDITAHDRQRFAAALAALARSGRTWVLATLRSDFYAACNALDDLVELKEGFGQYDLKLPTPAEIGQMIRQPSAAAGLRFESHPDSDAVLDDVLRDAAASDTSSLPLLEFMLDELYRQRTDHGVLTFAAYTDLGGVEGALARRAEETFSDLPRAVQDELPAVFRQLVTVSDQADDRSTRKQASLALFADSPGQTQFVRQFVAARLFVTDQADDGSPVIRVTHESLLSRWDRLNAWLATDRELLRIRSRVSAVAARWDQEGRRADLLLPPGKPLDEALQLKESGFVLEPTVEALILKSHHRARRRARLRKVAVAGLGVLTIVFACLATFARWQWKRAETADRARYDSLVDGLMNADDSNVPGILGRLSIDRGGIVGKLRWEASEGQDPHRQLRAILGLLELGDTEPARRLGSCILSASAAELFVLQKYLGEISGPQPAEWIPAIWSRLKDTSLDDRERFRAACVLGTFDPNGADWDTMAGYVARQLVAQPPSDVDVWINALRPVGAKLVPTLLTTIASTRGEPSAQANAFRVLADYATPADLVSAIVEAQGNELRTLLGLARQRDRKLTVELLTSIMRRKLDDWRDMPLDAASPRAASGNPITADPLVADAIAATVDDRYATPASNIEPGNQNLGAARLALATAAVDGNRADDAAELRAAHATSENLRVADARRLANASAGLLLFEQDGPVWQVFAANPRPTARSLAIQLCALVDVSPIWLWKRLKNENDISVRRAMIYCLGNYTAANLPPEMHEEISTYLLAAYQNDPDAGVHAAAEWALRRWGREKELSAINEKLARRPADIRQLSAAEADGARWYVNSQGQTFVALSPRKFQMGSHHDEVGRNQGDDAYSESLTGQSLDYSFAIATKEVTNQDFAKFLAATNVDPPPKDSDKYSPDPRGPRPGMSWLLAAKYCRWLGEQERVPHAKQCFPAIAEIRDGMTLPTDWLQRTGYRLPTDREWECACRAGTTTARYYGEGTELLAEYGWYGGNNPTTQAYVGGQKKANDFGIFDLYGNGFEWCMDGVTTVLDDQRREVISATSRRYARGGGMSSPPNEVRSAHRTSFEASRGGFTIVFRLARTLPATD